jgi:hypothetical protein
MIEGIWTLTQWKILCLNTLLLNDYTSVACAVGPSVTMSSADFSFENLVFFGIYLNFQQQKSLQNQYLLNSESRSSNNTKGTFQFLQKIHLRFNLIFSEELI